MSGPPHASFWAAPPEFYVDESFAGKSLRRALQDLGYPVHTPPELYGTRDAAIGTPDTVWLRDVGARRWVVIGRDTKILERPDEAAAYRAARVHMFLFPGQATRAVLIECLTRNLREICTVTAGRAPVVCRVTRSGLEIL